MHDSDKQAVAGLVAKYNRFFTEMKKDEELKIAVELRLENSKLELANYRAAFKLFGFEFAEGLWEQVREAIGTDLYLAALKDPDAAEKQGPPHPTAGSETPGSSIGPAADRPKIREIVLSLLKTAGDKGDGATALRKQIEVLYNISLHEKTVGMTLYRLSQDGLVRREGRSWFFVPQTAETKNPGVHSPGQLDLIDNER